MVCGEVGEEGKCYGEIRQRDEGNRLEDDIREVSGEGNTSEECSMT